MNYSSLTAWIRARRESRSHHSLNLPPLLRGEIYGIERLEELARTLAQSQVVSNQAAAHHISVQMATAERELTEANRVFTIEAQQGGSIPPAVEWLLDNFHIVQEQIHQIRQDLTHKYYTELPKLADGEYAGYPRVYALAFELITHTDSNLDINTLTRFVQAYESVTPLTLGELWAIPIMLRIGLVENLRRAMLQSLVRFHARQRANEWADRILRAASRSHTELTLLLVELERTVKPEPEFIVQLMQRLRDQAVGVAPAIQWLEDALAKQDTDIEQYLRLLNQRRTVNRGSVGNAITSMRTLSTTDWQVFVEHLSLVEQILSKDPVGVYKQMDAATRDRYRHVVEELSKGTKVPEPRVAQEAIDAAAHMPREDNRRAHVGYFLMNGGLKELRKTLGYRVPLRDRASEWVLDHSTLFYLGLSTILTVCFVAAALSYAAQFQPSLGMLVLTALLMVVPASVFAVGIVNWTVTVEVPPNALPKMEFKGGIPPEFRTIVVVPALLSTVSGVTYLLDHLEQRRLTNRDANLYFALLTDFGDAPTEHRPEDDALLEAAISGIEQLNKKYAEDDGTPDAHFYLFHRERLWNPVQQQWMGWERKRGKLLEFNRLLRGDKNTSYTTIIGDQSILPTIRYVITLDADTELPLNGARRLAGALAHPLNHAVLNEKTHAVIDGYGILQPRVDITADAAAQTRFARIMTGDAGLDPYSSVVSDVYQDLFRTGVYVGKAIYDVDAMHAALDTRFPENLLLSHDLLEGGFVRTALVSDIVLMEDIPSGLDAFMQRQNRWTRGDWQITAWLFPRVPDATWKRIPNPLPFIERWKIFDNLRRSLVPPALILFLLAGWMVLPGAPLVWTLVALGAMLFPLLRRILSALGVHPHGESWRDYFFAIWHEVRDAAKRAFLIVTLALFQALENLDAIFRALWRRAFDRRYLLEWVSAAMVERGQAKTYAQYLRRMIASPIFSVLILALVIWRAPNALWLAAPFVLLWFVAPLVAAWLSQPLPEIKHELPEEAKAALLVTAQKIWHFYETFCTEADHWLPPDNYQVEPRPVVAHRTSPTNIGFLLLSMVAAFDFNILTADEMLTRVERVLDTLEQMERWQGHWYNWYDTLTLRPLYPRYVSTVDSGNLVAALIVVKQTCRALAEQNGSIATHARRLEECIESFLRDIDFRFLYSTDRDLFAVGFNVENNHRDTSYYDLLASEARLASYIAIAWGQVPDKHWFKLGRPLMQTQGRVALFSWGGTMFEYLMPTLFLPDYRGTLLNQTYDAIIARQIQYGEEHGIPWGISESGYYAFDFQYNYQYRMFGVPDLSLKREFGENLVIAPYATFLALPYAPERGWENLQRLKHAGATDGFGFYEALDYTPSRHPKGTQDSVVREFMAHHQGMSLVALDNLLNDNAIQKRFLREPAMAAIELVLQERIPEHKVVVALPPEERPPMRPVMPIAAADTRVYKTPHTRVPRTQITSNGEYSVMVTNAGGSYSAYKDIQVTRWRADVTRDNWGSFIYIQDVGGRRWSATYQPTRVEPNDFHVTYTPESIEFWREDDDIETLTELAVSPEANVEIRRVTLTNRDSREHILELTSYAEVVLAPARTDAAHPAFNKLFIESEYVPEQRVLLFKRRPRDPNQQPLWAFHVISSADLLNSPIEYETDRMKFIGRGGSLENPRGLAGRLSNTTGAVLDPVMSLRGRVRIRPGRFRRISFITGVAGSREEALQLASAYTEDRAVERALDLAHVHSHILMGHLNITTAQAQLFQSLASRVLYPEPAFRAPSAVLTRNTRGQKGLWSYGISGDYPIVLTRVHAGDDLDLIRQLLLAHEFWRLHNFHVDLVILDESPTTYAEGINVSILNIVSTSLSHQLLDKPGGIFIRRAEHMPAEDRVLLQTVARVVLSGELGDLEQIRIKDLPELRGAPPPVTLENVAARPTPSPEVPVEPLQLSNGAGGFSQDGIEYVIPLNDKKWTPLPWSNVLANANGGALVTESGLGYVWAGNSQQNKLTPWSNDPVRDHSGQIIYITDGAMGAVWTPTPLPIREREPYLVRHGAGYTQFEHTSHEITQTLEIFSPKQDPVVISRLKLRNHSRRLRRLTITFFAEWVLAVNREDAQYFVTTEHDAATGALLARNTYNGDYTQSVAFAAITQPTGYTADRTEFLGRNGTSAQPRALATRAKLSGKVDAGADPCAVLQTTIELPAGEEDDVVFLLGEGQDINDTHRLIQQYLDRPNVQVARNEVRAFWNDFLETIQVKTPDAALDVMLNRWLLYQTLACRMWGRSAFYQSGGAYGFRDQLQDGMALVYAAPQLTREHILRAASRQFLEGDVQHWWHPESGAGIRTHISDDALWLPFVVVQYVTTTGDTGILDEQISFIEMPLLTADQHEAYGVPDISAEKESLYEHCLRAIAYSEKFGEHGLPLMGTGDWNDGMNAVGAGGKGESVWLGWFMYATLMRFAPLAEQRGDKTNADKFRETARTLQTALEEQSWDGTWYRRAYFDDGSPLGSAQNQECQIDAIAQAWAAISGAGSEEHTRTALQSASEKLVRDQERMLLLLTPSFDHSDPSPGYIQGYLKGIRENGGQYTHGALWLALAHFYQGDGDRAYQLLQYLNPLEHARNEQDVARYQVEPYVIAADIYWHPQHIGRGGWTWYTGSAGWFYRIGLEYLLGFRLQGDSFTLEPCIPHTWSDYQITYRDGETTYEINVENPNGVNGGVQSIYLDDTERADKKIPRAHDNKKHRVRVVMGRNET